MASAMEHKCPSCGASLEFDAASQNIKCPYCDCEFDVSVFAEAEGDLSIGDVDLAADGGVDWDDGELYGVSEYQCESCGGNIYSDAPTSATMCPYCGNAVILKGRLTGSLKPDKVIPFQKDKEQALKGLEEYCGGKRFVPKKFLKDNKLEEIKGLYVPFWVYDADLDAHVEYLGVDERTWRSGDTEYTERKYYRVIRGGDIAFDHVPADGSSKMPDDLMESIEPFDYDKAENFTTAYLPGYVADKYDLDQDAVRPRVRQRMAEGTADKFMTTVHYDEVSVKDAQISAKKSEVNYVLYPVWLMNTTWNGKKFTFAMNGQTGKTVGNLPADYVKLGSVSGSIFAAVAALFILGFYFMDGGFDVSSALVGIVIGALAGGLFFWYFKRQLKTVEFQHGAANYYREGSMNITVKQDKYLYKRVTTRHINRN